MRQGRRKKSEKSVLIGLVQLQLPNVTTPTELAAQTRRVCEFVGHARRRHPDMDLIAFPEYCLHGISMDTNQKIMCRRDGAEVEALRHACHTHRIWGCFSIMEYNPNGNPYNTGLIIDDTGEIRIFYRKLNPWVPVEPWEPGNLGLPVCNGPNGSRLALIICHDGMFPETVRECAYKGANIMLRIAGYTAPIRHAWRITNQANSFCNVIVTAGVSLGGGESMLNSKGGAMIVNYDGVTLVEGSSLADEIITAEVRPDLVDVARRAWDAQNSTHQMNHRGYMAIPESRRDCPYTYMKDMVARGAAASYAKVKIG